MSRPGWTLGHVPVAPFMATRTAVAPGIGPLEPSEWLYVDDDCAAQMALRDALIEGPEREDLGPVAMTEGGEDAAAELAEAVTDEVVARHGARRAGGAVVRRDGVSVALDGDPIAVAGRLAQEDFLVMEKPEGAAEHVLTAGVLCFPAHWRLDEKIGRPLLRIHLPVTEYPGELEKRVQRFFDGVKVGRPLMRANWHFAASPEIVTPAHEAEKMRNYERRLSSGGPAWLRVERQTVLRLPRTGAVVFGVRTLMSDVEGLTTEQWRALAERFEEMPEAQRTRKASPALVARAREAAA
jgi:hypothetical protein